MGVLTITAPHVPPRTMMAAVIWEMSWSLPPSMIRPPTIPPKARIRPPSVAKSGRVVLAFGVAARDLRRLQQVDCFDPPYRSCAFRPALQATRGLVRMRGHRLWPVRNQAAKLDHLLDHFISGLHDDQLLTCGQRNHGVRRRLDVFDKVRVQN